MIREDLMEFLRQMIVRLDADPEWHPHAGQALDIVLDAVKDGLPDTND